MTEWQWQVILALIRIVLDLNNRYTRGEYTSKEEELLREALEREKVYQGETNARHEPR